MANNIRFVDQKTKNAKNVPSLRNFESTLHGFNCLWQDLQKLGFDNFSPRNVNQELIHNFFRMVRTHGK